MFALCCVFVTSKAAVHGMANKLGIMAALVSGGRLTVALPMSQGLVAVLTLILRALFSCQCKNKLMI